MIYENREMSNMKKILITGANSFIGTAFEAYMQNQNGACSVDTVDTVGDAWQKTDFSDYDAVFHVAGIVHIRETEENKELYYRVNRDLAVQIARRAKLNDQKIHLCLTYNLNKKFDHPD